VEAVADIKEALMEGAPTSEVAEKWGVSSGSVRDIKSGKTWKDVGLECSALPDAVGSRHHNARITEADAEDVLLRVLSGQSHTEVARHFGVTRGVVSSIWHGKTWKHIPRPPGTPSVLTHKRTTKVPTPTVEADFWSRADKTETGCWLWSGTLIHGYGSVRFRGRSWRAHRLAWILTHGQIPKDQGILHLCDQPSCIRPEHLYAGSHSENMQDAHNRSRFPRTGQRPGEAHAMAKLTAEDVRAIHSRLVNGESQAALSKAFGVTASNIGAISRGKSWRHLGLPKITK
jgi:hypothetical protein